MRSNDGKKIPFITDETVGPAQKTKRLFNIHELRFIKNSLGQNNVKRGMLTNRVEVFCGRGEFRREQVEGGYTRVVFWLYNYVAATIALKISKTDRYNGGEQIVFSSGKVEKNSFDRGYRYTGCATAV